LYFFEVAWVLYSFLPSKETFPMGFLYAFFPLKKKCEVCFSFEIKFEEPGKKCMRKIEFFMCKLI